jgi:aryl-alcohol dehydrogenase-like predicted oxidoreductase
MELRNLGKSGLRVSLVGLGCNNFGGDRIDAEASRRVIHKALDLGITMFDTADVYGDRGESERILGAGLGERRKDIVLATKFGLPMDEAQTLKGAFRRYIMAAAEDSLRRLRTDWIDLYWAHRPDPLTPIEETLRALDDLVRQGKVRYIGCSKFAAWQLADAQWTAQYHQLNAFIACQEEYNLFTRGLETDLEPAMSAYGVGLVPYSPLASGLLTGKYQRNAPLPAGTRLARERRKADQWLTETNWTKLEALQNFSRQRGHNLLELAMSWLASRPLLGSIIAGATQPEQLEINVRAASWKLMPDELAEVDRLSGRQPRRAAQ